MTANHGVGGRPLGTSDNPGPGVEDVVREGRCPHCRGRVQWHSLSVWCLRCGWASNRPHPTR